MEIQKTSYVPPQQLTMNSDDAFNFIAYKILNFLVKDTIIWESL